ncbi:MAG TPA: M28 family peptidase [Hyphomicrobiaceae bacterium]|nr:M28 family peptidase [Hyphomicrobiaceae bacterium]
MWWIALFIALPAAALAIALAGWYALALPGRPHKGPLPVATAEERDIAARLETHVRAIASEPHNLEHYEALERAALYIERALGNLGYAVERQEFTARGRTVRNIAVVREPDVRGQTTSSLVVGAHYDSYRWAPGANDNGTGVAAVLELARLLREWQAPRTRLRLVLFVNEEPPYYRTADMGSLRYARLLSELGETVLGMISLETLGAFSDQPGSQRYPPPFGLVFPSTADFVAIVGLTGSRAFLHEVVASFRRHTAFPTIGGVAPDLVPGIGWSDHWAFRRYGYPAIMITDTALYRYPHYHLPSDTPDKVDYGRLARITKGLERVVRAIAR